MTYHPQQPDLSPFDHLPVVDHSLALERLGEDATLFQDMANFFVEDSPLLVEQITLAAANGNLTEVHRAAHGLKGLAANVEGCRVMEAARLLDEAAVAGRSDKVTRLAPVAAALVEELRRQLKADA